MYGCGGCECGGGEADDGLVQQGVCGKPLLTTHQSQKISARLDVRWQRQTKKSVYPSR